MVKVKDMCSSNSLTVNIFVIDIQAKKVSLCTYRSPSLPRQS